MASFFELLMMICFGVSWPFSVYKSYKSRTAKGKSIVFLSAIWIGYICGMLGKVLSGNVNYVIVMYIINTLLVTADILLYIRNTRFDKLEAEA